MGYELVASSGTARFLQNNDIPAAALAWPLEDKNRTSPTPCARARSTS
jgi:hypothetical protein